LLEGLEISEVLFSVVESTDLLRLEAEFHTAKTFKVESSFLGADIIELSQYGTSNELNEDGLGYPVLRLNEFDASFITTPSKYCNLLNETTYKTLKLKKGDVLICRTNGNPRLVGKSALVPKDYEFAYASYLFKIRPKQELITSSTLVAYLNSKFGRMEIEKYSMASNQVNFSPAKFRELRIPRFSIKLNNQIDKNTFEAFRFLETSKALYAQAEQILLEAVGLADFKPTTQNINIKTFAQSFGTSRRLDAEYYQPKYEDYLKLIFGYKDGWAKLSEIFELKDSNYNPHDETEYQYIELSDIDKSGGITGCTKDLGENLPSRARRLVRVGDVVISSIEGSLTSCAMVPVEYDNALCSTGFYVVKSQEINSETLLVLMKSELMQSILKQNCSGTILTALNKDEFSNLPIPKIDLVTQTNISQLVQQSFHLKAQSEHLLSVAKRAVEIAIEQDEATAMSFIANS
jgi:restriction endonuclease S subunit